MITRCGNLTSSGNARRRECRKVFDGELGEFYCSAECRVQAHASLAKTPYTTPPTISRSAVPPEARAALEVDRANRRPAPAPTRVNEAYQLLAAEMVGDQRDRAADVLSRNVRIAAGRKTF